MTLEKEIKLEILRARRFNERIILFCLFAILVLCFVHWFSDIELSISFTMILFVASLVAVPYCHSEVMKFGVARCPRCQSTVDKEWQVNKPLPLKCDNCGLYVEK